MIVEGGVGLDVFIKFLKRILIGAKRKIFLIVGSGAAHKSKKTKPFVESQKRNLSYSICLHIHRNLIQMNLYGII